MIRVLLDPYRIGDIAEECGIQPKTKPLPDGGAEITLEVLVGSGRVEFYSRVPSIALRAARIAPPTVDSLAGAKYE